MFHLYYFGKMAHTIINFIIFLKDKKEFELSL